MPKGAGSQTLAWDWNSRLKQAGSDTAGERYDYSADNRLVYTKEMTTGAEAFTFRLGAQVLGTYTPTLNAYGTITGFSTTSTRRAPFLDGLKQHPGSTDSYFPYGEKKEPPIGTEGGFGTYSRREATGLDYADQRWYSSTTGRFLTPDPYLASGGPGRPGSWNRYGYVEGDPVNRVDPTGLFTIYFVCTAYPGPFIDVGGEPGSVGTYDTACYHVTMSGPARRAKRLREKEWRPPIYNILEDLRDDAVAGLRELLTDCYEAVGAASEDDAVARLNSMRITFDSLGPVDYDRPAQSPGIADVSGRHIRLNADINWIYPQHSRALSDGGVVPYPALDSLASQVNATSVTAEQFMQFIIAHEVKHTFGLDHPPGDAAAYNRDLWNQCFGNSK